MRRRAAVIVAVMLMLGLAGCDTSCPAIGWSNSLRVDTGAIDDVAELQFCIDEECSPRAGETQPTGSTATMFRVDRDGDDWTLNLDMTAPESVVIRVFAADGALLRESEHTIDWTPPTGQCGGASTAQPIVLAG